MKKAKKVTLSDVAKLSGVSPSTVSRVISNSTKISQATKLKVLKSMEELGYYPNAIARSLAKQETGTIGIIMPNRREDVFANPFFPEVLSGILKAASNNDYDILLSTNTEKGDDLKSIKNFIGGSKVDGLVLMSSQLEDPCIEYLSSIDFPFSLIGSPADSTKDINHVDNDNLMAAYELSKYLISTGKNKIAMIAGDSNLIVTQKRIEGYKKALEDSNIKFQEDLLFLGDFHERTGYMSGKKLLKMKPRPDAFIVTDDLLAIGAIRLLEGFNISIPQDIAIASFNNSILSRYSHIPFTSVDINAYKLGEESINLLVQVIKKEMRVKKIIIPHKIYKRRSTEKQ